ncbi:hypothetical protein LY76DRAFT_595780 [Colletotrichum caudatum]|nr:hypothetical protein LY76DRAFT_595780 [Colletotrichum caudatum]
MSPFAYRSKASFTKLQCTTTCRPNSKPRPSPYITGIALKMSQTNGPPIPSHWSHPALRDRNSG